jgi:hypothetical protein
MTSAPSDNLPPEIILESELRTTLAEEEKLYHDLNAQKLARESQWKDTRSSTDWLNSTLDITRVVLDSSNDVISVVSSFVGHLSSVVSIHGSECTFRDLKGSLPSTGPAKQSWESVAGTINTLLNQIEELKSATSSHIKCMDAELETSNTMAHQTQMSLVTLTKRIDELSHSMHHKRSILHPIRRVPTEILEHIFEQASWEERSALRAVRAQTIHLSRNDIYSTIPRIPTILASTCRRWRSIALNMTRLWNFLRVPTLETYFYLPGRISTCVAGLSPFRQAMLHIGASECEVVVGPSDWNMINEYLHSIPRSQISVMNVISPPEGLDFSQVPTARVLRILKRGINHLMGAIQPPHSCILPASVLADTKELECHHALPVVNAPIHSVTSFSLSINNHAVFPDLGDVLANFPNLAALVLRVINTLFIYNQRTFTPFHHARISMLSITDSVVPHLCASLKRGAFSLPSLTNFILLSIEPFVRTELLDHFHSLFVKVTHFDIRTGNQQDCGPYVRRFLDFMPFLRQFSLFGTAVDCGLDALLIAPIKQIDNLIILDSGTDGSNVNSYYDALSSESADGNLDMSIQFVNCAYILPHIQERFPCR